MAPLAWGSVAGNFEGLAYDGLIISNVLFYRRGA